MNLQLQQATKFQIFFFIFYYSVYEFVLNKFPHKTCLSKPQNRTFFVQKHQAKNLLSKFIQF